MQPTLTKKDVLRALREFDKRLRGNGIWSEWEENQAHKYAIRHGHRKYPVKQIASMASGVPVSKFSGGEYPGHANKLFTAVGMKVVPLHPTNPDWARDELILALNFYLNHRPNPPSKSTKAIRDLSILLNRLGKRLFPSSERSETFRNVNGVYMKLMNFRRLDPEYTASGKKGLTAGAKEEEEVWREFAGNARRCEEVAQAIVEDLGDDLDDSVVPASDQMDDGMSEAPEGRLLTHKHVMRERSRKLVERKKHAVIKAVGKLECEICGFDFAIRYGKRGEGFLECHHTKPVATLAEGNKTHIKDLALLCANCHRMIHREKPWLTVDDVRNMLRPSAPYGGNAGEM